MKFKSGWLLTIGLLLLFALEILRVYFIMPFPGSQQSDTIGIAYFLDKNIIWLRILVLLIVRAFMAFYPQGKALAENIADGDRPFYGLIFYMFNFRFLADKMFYQPREKLFAGAAADTTNKNKLIIGVALKGEARAYPVEVIGYHHQVKDTVAGSGDGHLLYGMQDRARV